MKSPTERSTRFDDDRIAALLVEFYADEMPTALRTTTDPAGAESSPVDAVAAPEPVVRPTIVRRESVATSPGRGAGGLAGLVAVAASLAVFVVAVQVAGPTRPRGPVDDGVDVARDDRSVEPTVDVPREDALPPAFTLTEDDLFVERVEGRVESLDRERFDTARGPVELRAVRETTNVSVVDPTTGRGIDLETQVLDIEIVPIELDADPTFDAPAFDPTPPDELPLPRDDAPRLPEAGAPR